MDFFDEQVGGSRVCSARAQKGQEMMVHNPADAEVKKALVRTKRPKIAPSARYRCSAPSKSWALPRRVHPSGQAQTGYMQFMGSTNFNRIYMLYMGSINLHHQ